MIRPTSFVGWLAFVTYFWFGVNPLLLVHVLGEEGAPPHVECVRPAAWLRAAPCGLLAS
jgi:hypothetical protein